MDFVIGLPKCKAYGQIYDAIFIVIDRLFKKRYYIPYSEEDERTSTEATADLFLQNVWFKHSLPISMTLNYGPQFILKIWNSLCKLLEITAKLSTPFYPETNGQNKNVNQEAEQYLKSYINHF